MAKAKKAQLGLVLAGAIRNNPITQQMKELRGKIGNAAGIPGKPIAKKGAKISKTSKKKK